MNEPQRKLANLEIIGGHPAIDFVNTVGAWNAPGSGDYLHGFEDFIRWNEMRGLLWREPVEHFLALPEAEQAAAFEDVLKLRRSLHAVLAARAAYEPLPQDALDHLNDVIRGSVAWRYLHGNASSGRREVCCAWEFEGAPATAALGPVAWSAAELLENGPVERLKECPGERCGWLFLDTSKNRSRQWCSMKTCGNAAKVRRFRKKQNE